MSSSTSPENESQRPVDETPSPKIWRRLTIRNNNTGERYNIRIQNIPSDRYDEVWDMFREHYYTDEPVNRSINMSAEEESMSSANWDVHETLSQNLSIIAVLDNNRDRKPTILGGLLLLEKLHTYEPRYKSIVPPSTEKKKNGGIYMTPKSVGIYNIGVYLINIENYYRKLVTLYEWMRIDDNLLEELGTNCLLVENGLVVKRDYRGMGIGLELFRTVKCIAEKYGFPAVAGVSSHPGAKEIGVTLGMTLLKEGRLVDCVDESGQKIFPDTDPEITLVSGYIKY